MPKKVTRRYSSLRRVRVSSKIGLLLGVGALVVAIPVTLSLVSDSQDIRQDAATQVAATVITTVPEDILIISVSEQDGNMQGRSDSGEGNDNGEEGQSGGTGECTTDDSTTKDVGGQMRVININCDGQDQGSDQSGKDGESNIKDSSGKDGNIDKGGGGKKSKEGKGEKDGKGKKDKEGKQRKNLIQQFVDFIMGRQGR